MINNKLSLFDLLLDYLPGDMEILVSVPKEPGEDEPEFVYSGVSGYCYNQLLDDLEVLYFSMTKSGKLWIHCVK